MKRIIPIIIAMLLTLPAISGLGISPIKTVWEFRPNIQVGGTLKVIRETNEPLEYGVSAQGALAEYITLPNKVTFKQDQRVAKIAFSAQLPERAPQGKSYITVSQSPTPGAGVRSMIALNHVVELRIPPLSTHFVYKKEPEPAILANISNPGLEMQRVQAVLTLYDNNKEVSRTNTQKQEIAPGKESVLYIRVPALSPGHYTGNIRVTSEITSVEKPVEITIGTPTISIEEVNLEKNRISLKVKSVWNQKITLTNTMLEITSGSNTIYSEATGDTAIEAGKTAEFNIEVERLPHTYDITITATVEESQVSAYRNIVAGKVVEQEKTPLIAIIGIVLIVAANIILILALYQTVRPKKRKRIANKSRKKKRKTKQKRQKV